MDSLEAVVPGNKNSISNLCYVYMYTHFSSLIIESFHEVRIVVRTRFGFYVGFLLHVSVYGKGNQHGGFRDSNQGMMSHENSLWFMFKQKSIS